MIILISGVIPPSGLAQISKFLPTRTGGTGNLLYSATDSSFSDSGSIYVQNFTVQNQSSHAMYLGNSTVTDAVGGGIQLTASGSYTSSWGINYGSFVSEWFLAGTPGDPFVFLGNT